VPKGRRCIGRTLWGGMNRRKILGVLRLYLAPTRREVPLRMTD
jgi:hypothetical protein